MSTDNIIAVLGVVVTAFFTYMVYKATKATADVARETYELNRSITEQEEKRISEQKRIMRRLLLPRISKESKLAYDAVVDIDYSNIYKKLVEAPETLSISEEDLANYFSTEEVSVMIRAWEVYEKYRSNYFRKNYGGDGMKILLEKAPPVIEAFSELENLLNDIRI